MNDRTNIPQSAFRNPQSIDPIEAFYQRVNARAEADILSGNPIPGAHHRALEIEIHLHRTGQTAPLNTPHNSLNSVPSVVNKHRRQERPNK